MQDNNPYSAPSATVADIAPAGSQELAGRWIRLAAVLIDGLIGSVLLVPMMIAGGYFSGILSGQQPGMGMQLLWGLMGFVVFVVIQGYPLAQSGQTWGKKLLKIRIVDLEGRQPALGSLIGKRYAAMYGFSLIPFVGWLINLVNLLFIFRDDRRCIHDLIAGTRVVVAD